MTDTIRIGLLGGVEVSGTDVAPLPSRALALLGYLVVHPDTPQPRAHLAGVLWPDSNNAQARTNLRRELHHLRALLVDTGCLEVDLSTLTWHDRPGCEVDVRAFLCARQDALTALENADVAGFEVGSRRALGHYHGSFLPGCYDDWALAARDDLQHDCVELCDRGAAFWQEYGDPAAALDLVRRRIILEPLEEPGYRQMMRLQRATGDRAGALRTYHRCASVLEQDLGVTPSTETKRELDALLREGTSTARHAASSPRPTGTSWSLTTGLVGRDEERARLLDAWSEARAGCRFVLVTGDAGAGKTRLVADLATAVHKQDGVVATARCFAATGGLPFAPVAEWLRAPHLRLSAKRLNPVWHTEVERLVPERDDPAHPQEGARAKVDAWQRLRFFEGLARAVVAVDRPLLLTVEDLQWCDKASLSWLSFLVSYARSAPLLVVATAREEELRMSDLAGPLRMMGTAGQVTSMVLGPLSAQDTELLANRVVGHVLGDAELALVRSVTAGNPFYIIEALREAAATPGPVQPADLGGVLNSRLSRLSEPAQQVVALASAVGRDFGLDLLIEASDLEPDTVVRLVDELWHTRILEQRGPGYDFAHDLLREAAYAAVTPARKWLLHRRLAQALELLYAERTDSVAAVIAEQYHRSGQPERALPFYDRAARQATSVFANAEAVRLWERCLELIGAMPVSRQRDERELAILEQLLPPLNAWRGYASKELEAVARRSATLGERLDLEHIQATASIALFSTTFVQGHIVESFRCGEQALMLSVRCPELAGQAHMAYAGPALSLGRIRDADRHFGLACELSGESDSLPIGTRTAVHARSWWAHALWLLGDEAGAIAASSQALELARQIEHPYSLAVALSYAAITHQMCGDRGSMELALDELTRLCKQYGFAYYRDWAVVLDGWLRGGRPGLRLAQEGIGSLRAEGSLARMPYWLWLVADLHRQAGDLPAATGVLDAARSHAAQHDDLWWLPEVLRMRASLEPGADAARQLERAVALAAEQSSTTLLARCRTDLADRTGALGTRVRHAPT